MNRKDTQNTRKDKITLKEWFEMWMVNYKYPFVKDSTIYLYQNCYERYISKLEDMYIDEIKSLDIQSLFRSMMEQNLSAGTIHIVRRILNNVFAVAIKCELITRNPCCGTIIPKENKESPHFLSKKEQQIFLQVIRNSKYENIYKIALATGLRIGELTALTWDDIDFKEKMLYVNRTLLYQKNPQSKKFEYYVQTPKSISSIRVIPLIPDAISILLEQQKLQQNLQQKERYKPLIGFQNLIFTTNRGTPIQEAYLIKDLRKISSQMNQIEYCDMNQKNKKIQSYRNITPHTLRHTFATRAFENGMSPKMVQNLMGHSSLSITMDLYTHVTMEAKKTEMKCLEGVLKDVSD